jgi:hypothetical protein
VPNSISLIIPLGSLVISPLSLSKNHNWWVVCASFEYINILSSAHQV